jgi:hypothetical protein
MDTSQIELWTFLQHLREDNTPLILKYDNKPPQWEDAPLHRAIYGQNPEFYSLFALTDQIGVWQQVKILFQILQSSRAGMARNSRQVLERVTAYLLAILPVDRVLKVFLALRRVRANHKHVTKAILNYILNHPQLEEMAIARRPTIIDCLEHALGKNVVRACVGMLASGDADAQYLQQNLFRFAQNRELVGKILPSIYEKTGKIEVKDSYKSIHTQYVINKTELLPKTVTATNRGDISATLIHIYRGGKSAELQTFLDEYVETATQKLPRFKGKMALVQDVSASTRSYGDREFCTLSQSIALQMVLQKCCDSLQIYTLGGTGELPIPEGHTDLAVGVLDALDDRPDLVAIVSDGCENLYPNDLARVVGALPDAGIDTPVVFCHSKFTPADDLSLRNPAPCMPQLEFWHQEDFENLLFSLYLRVDSPASRAGLQEFLLQKLDRFQQELTPWTFN